MAKMMRFWTIATVGLMLALGTVACNDEEAGTGSGDGDTWELTDAADPDESNGGDDTGRVDEETGAIDTTTGDEDTGGSGEETGGTDPDTGNAFDTDGPGRDTQLPSDTSDGGVPSGDGSTMGACCGLGFCQETSQSLCSSGGGDFTAGASCDDVECGSGGDAGGGVPCCFPGGFCQETSEDNCNRAQGTPKPNASSCEDAMCS